MALMVWERNGCEHDVPAELVDYYKLNGWKVKPAKRAKKGAAETKAEAPTED